MTTMNKPSKPYKDFPLTAHNNGKWCKKVRGKLFYFGTWDDPDAALAQWLEEKDYLLAGKNPPKHEGHTVYEVCDRFLQSKKTDLDTGEIVESTYKDYVKTCKLLKKICGDLVVEGLSPEDFQKIRAKLAEGVGTTTLGNRVRQSRVALRYIEEITGEPFKFPRSFREPSARAKRKARLEAGERMHTQEEIKGAIKKASPQMKAMILLGINCAFGNEDCGTLTWDKLDLENGWHNFERAKVYVSRRAKLWGRTVEALKAVPQTGELVFRTKYGNPWKTTAIAHEANKLGIEFYNLRRTFRTVAENTLETMAIRLVMGHSAPQRDMDARYVQKIEDKRLELVSEYVEAWFDG